MSSNARVGSSPTRSTVMDIKDLPQEYQDRIKRFDYFFVENAGHSFQEDDLFKYEMFVMEQSLVLYDHFKDVEDMNAYLNELQKSSSEKLGVYDIVKNIPGLDEGHSTNTLGATWLMFMTYKTRPEMVKFLHGSLAPLVGDEGYFDNREDVKEFLKEKEKEKENGI